MAIRRTGSGSRAGFTLVEVVVAIGILTGVLLGLAMGATSVIRTNKSSYGTTLATTVAQDRLEELKARTSSALPSCPDYADTGTCSDTIVQAGVSFQRHWRILSNTPSSGINRIDVRVTWTDYRDNTLTLSSNVPQ